MCQLPVLTGALLGMKATQLAHACWCLHVTFTRRRYVLPTALPQLPTRRAGVPDQWLVNVLSQATSRLRSHLGQPQRRALAARDAAEMLQLMTLESAPDDAAAAAATAAADLPGRQSGAEAWRQARGETGVCLCVMGRA